MKCCNSCLTLCTLTSLLLLEGSLGQQQLQFLGEQPFRAYASRSTTLGQVLYQLFAVNSSSGEANRITYFIDQATDLASSRHFSLRPDTGELRLQALFSSLAEHVLVIEARSEVPNAVAVRTNLVVVVIPESELRPRFERGNYSLSVCECRAVQQPFSIIRAFPFRTTTSDSYSVISDTSAGSFSINAANGLLSLTLALDRERVDRYFLTIRYSFDERFIDADVIVDVLDANDNAPCFIGMIYNVTITEDSGLSTSVLTVSAIDLDFGSNGEVRYSLMAHAATNDFSLDSRTGVLSVSSELDYERVSRYQLTVIAVDAGSPPSSAAVTVVVNVGNVDDECPRFDNPLYIANIDASQLRPDLLVLTVIARDPDGLGNNRLTYVVVSSNVDIDALSLDEMTGEITITNASTSRGQYSLNISASDSSCMMNSFTWVDIRIIDTNDHSPEFVTPCNATLPENPALGTEVVTLTATDADMGVNGEITYSLLNTSLFSIDPIGGIVTTNQIPSSYDREAQEVFQVGAVASDGGLRQNYCLLTVTLLDQNDNPPTFVLPFYNISLASDTPPFTAVAMTIAFDTDMGANGNLSYSLSRPINGNFSIDQATGEVSTTGPNSPGSYSLSVTAADSGEPSLSSSVGISIDVVSGGTPPVFNHLYYNTTICENVPVSKPVFTISATGNPTYTLGTGADYSSNSENAFVLSDSTLRVGSQVLVDFERLNSRKSFLFAVIACNEAGSSFAIIEIFVEDLDDNPPMVDSGYSFSLAENQIAGLVVTQLLAHDPDSGTNGEIAYHLSEPSPFQVSSTGVITSTHTFDFENANEPHRGDLSIELYNPNPASSNTSIIRERCKFEVFLDSTSRIFTVRWRVLDQNDNPPEFSESTYTVPVPENQQMQIAIFNLTASDLDDSDSARLSFAITDGNDGTFVIAAGSLVLLRRLDYETRSRYNLTIEVTDGVHSRSSCSRCVAIVTVMVLDVDDEPPIFSPPAYSGRVVEMAAPGTSILTLATQDADSSTTSYRLTGKARERFGVRTSGEVFVSGPINREDFPGGVVSFLAIAESGGLDTAEVNVTILDINDNAPRFLNVFSGRVLENMVPGDEGILITQVTAQDPDEARNGTVTYTLRSGTENGFRINSSSGIITAHMEYDREMQSSHFLVVEAADNGTPARLSSTSLVVVDIGDVNDNPPFFPFPFMFARLFESEPIGSHVLDIPIYDPDERTNADIVFSLLSSTLPDKFSLNPATGEVLVAGSLDYEIPQHRSATLIIGIQEPQFPPGATGMLVISLLDRNDNAPRVDPPNYNHLLGSMLTISETFPPGQTLATINAEDDDQGSNGELDFAIVRGDSRGDFVISNTGRVTNIRQLDYETTSRYDLIVSVSDRGSPPQSTEVTLEFNVQDINDNLPSFSQAVYSVSVVENQPPDSSILQVAATDPDTEIGGLIDSYRIISGNVETRFSLNSSTGVLGTNAEFDREEEESYTLTITVNDQGADSQTGTGMIQVTIVDVNDNPSQMGGAMSVFIYDGGGLVPYMRLGTVFLRDQDTTSNTFQSCQFTGAFSFPDLFVVDRSDCTFMFGENVPGEGEYRMNVLGRDGKFTSVITSIVVTVQEIEDGILSNDAAVTVTVNASAEEYHMQGLHSAMPILLAQHLGVDRLQIHPLSLQPGYHDPLNAVDLTFVVTTQRAEGFMPPTEVFMPPTEVINRLFLSRGELFIEGHGVVAIPTDPCMAEPCFNQAKCSVTRTLGPTQAAASSDQYILLTPVVALGYECTCIPGTAGESCEVNYDDCYSNPCMHNVQCTDTVQGFLCDCPEGTSGPDCSFNPDECASSPCLNDAQCFNGFNTYLCDCLPGYYGQQCQYAHFQVSSSCFPDPCLNSGTCSPGRDGFTCLCPDGFNGTLCETAVLVRGGCVGNPCYNGSSCTDTNEGPVCSCSAGFTGPFCRWPLNNCELEPCQNGGVCETGLYGSYLCTCAPGYEGENCSQRVLACDSGPCLNGGRCSDNVLDGTFACQCHRNYTGPACETAIVPPDICNALPLPCSTFSNCTSGSTAVTCTCLEGYQGSDCSSTSDMPLSACASNPCQYGGTCSPDPLASYTCACSSGFSGTDCSTNIDNCASDPCQNGGTCQDGIDGFICRCIEGITGEVCQVLCPEGQVGEFCEVILSYCTASSCHNGGTCVEVIGGFTCLCLSSYTGPMCEMADNCTTTDCVNGGMCSTSPEEGARCACDTEFGGPNCQLLTASFTGSSVQQSYRAFQPLQSQGRVSLTLEFATRAQQGLLLFSTQYQGGESRDAIAVEVVGGRLRVSLALGSGAGSLAVMGSSVYVSDGQWHQASIQVRGKVSAIISPSSYGALQ